MKNIKSLTNLELLSKTRILAAYERRLGVELLHHIREIDARKLYADGHASLHEFLVQELKYSDGAAHRRIQAMRLVRDLPEAEDKLRSGAITLTTASQLQNFFRAEKKIGATYSIQEKRELLTQIQEKSTRQTEGLLAAISPQAVPREYERALNETERSVTFVMPLHLSEKLSRLRGLLAHRNASPTYAELFEILADISIENLDPSRRPMSKTGKKYPNLEKSPTPGAPAARDASAASAPAYACRVYSAEKLNFTETFTPHGTPIGPRLSRYVPAPLRRLTWSRAAGKCEYRDRDGRRCASSYALEMDHKIPVGQGGPATEENLQLLCRTHNAHKNSRDYGFQWRRAEVGSESSLPTLFREKFEPQKRLISKLVTAP